MIKESKYIFRRVIIGVLITLILSFISSCEVHAETRPISNTGLKARYYPSTNWSNINYNQWTTIPTDNSLYGLQMTFENGTNESYSPIGGGTYLFDFYIETNNLTSHLSSCNGLNTNFEFVDGTTGNWVSASANSSSTCLDSYYTLIGGNKTIHYLIQWQITDTFSHELFINEMRFTLYNYTGAGFVDYNGSYYVILGTLQDYDPQIVANFKKLANDNANNQATINSINSNTQNIINNQSQNTQDIINNQNQLNQNVINNNNSNTNSIINNQNQNKQDLIDNQNANTDKEIESQNVCSKYDKNAIELEKKYLTSDGSEITSGSSQYGISKYIKINSASKINVLVKYTENDYACFYNINKELISCINQKNYNVGDFYPIPNNSSYFRYSLVTNTNRPQLQICSNGNQAMNDSINDLNDSITDDSIPSDSESKINSITDKIKENQNTSIVQIATFFPQMLQLIINGMNTNCTGGYSLGTLYGTELTIPCINPVDYLGSFLWGVIDSILCLCYLIPLCKFLVNKYNDLTSMKNLRWQ